MKKLHSLLVLVLLFAGNASAQINLDSLYTLWQDPAQPDSTRSRAYIDYIWKGFLYSNPDTAIILAQPLLRFGETQHLPKATSAAYSTTGTVYWMKGDYLQALDHYQRSLNIQEEIGDKKGMAKTLNNMGNIHSLQDHYPEALDHYQRSSKIKEEMGDKMGVASSLNNIGMIYYEQKDYPQALDHFQRSLKIKEEMGDKMGVANSLNNIGLIYYEQKDYPQALDHYQRSLKIKEEMGNNTGVAGSLNTIGNIYLEQGDYPRALDLYQRSLSIREEMGDKNGIKTTLINMGWLHLAQGNNRKALTYCNESLSLSQEIGSLKFQEEACQCLYDVYKTMGNDKKALAYYEQMIAVRDSMFNEENTKKLTQLEMQYEFDKKEAATQAEQEKKDALAAQELQRQKLVRNGFMGGFAVVFLFAGVFFVQRNRIGKEKERNEELLLNILPAEVAEELKDKGYSDAQLIDHVTVLFTDFKGFTSLSEQLSPKELVADLHDCFSQFDRVCEKYGIEKIKTIGDAYMAAGGLPVPNTTHATDVTLAALEMAKVVEEGRAKKQATGEPYFEIRIGIHTGPVVAGIVGVKKFAYDIWGDTVNTASRMESSGEVGKVNVSETTYELLKDDAQFTFESRGKIAAKGKGEMEMFFVEAV